MRRIARVSTYLVSGGIAEGCQALHARYIGHYSFLQIHRQVWVIAYSAMVVTSLYAVGLPDLYGDRRRTAAWALTAVGIAALAISSVQLALGSLLLPRLVVFGSAVLLIPWSVLCSIATFRARDRDAGRDRIIAVVSEEDAVSLVRELERAAERPASVARVITVTEAMPSRSLPEPLVAAALDMRATIVVLDRMAQASEAILAQAATLHRGGMRVRNVLDFYEGWLGKLPVSELEASSMMFDIGGLHRARYARVQRVVDVFLAGVGLIVLGVVLPIIVVGDLLGNRGPLWYSQSRVGRNGKEFRILKFRTMRGRGAPEQWAVKGDDRVTPFGRLLRKSHLDELPQVWNVLRGDLAIVGPRPEQPGFVEELKRKLPYYDLRHLVRPGLTGWAQVKYAYADSEIGALEKLQFDFYYLRHQSLALDWRIIARTLRSVCLGDGR